MPPIAPRADPEQDPAAWLEQQGLWWNEEWNTQEWLPLPDVPTLTDIPVDWNFWRPIIARLSADGQSTDDDDEQQEDDQQESVLLRLGIPTRRAMTAAAVVHHAADTPGRSPDICRRSTAHPADLGPASPKTHAPFPGNHSAGDGEGWDYPAKQQYRECFHPNCGFQNR